MIMKPKRAIDPLSLHDHDHDHGKVRERARTRGEARQSPGVRGNSRSQGKAQESGESTGSTGKAPELGAASRTVSEVARHGRRETSGKCPARELGGGYVARTPTGQA